MMGVAGENVKADYVDSLDLFHTMEAYFTWYPNGAAGMSKYLLNKFLFTIDRDPDLVERYRTDPVETVTWWEADEANRILNCIDGERSTWLKFTDEERQALVHPRLPEALRVRRPPVPDPDPVHRVVRARPRGPGLPEGLRPGAFALLDALPGHRHMTHDSMSDLTQEGTMPTVTPAVNANGPLARRCRRRLLARPGRPLRHDASRRPGC